MQSQQAKLESIKPDLMVHAKGAGSMGGAKGVHVGTVDHMDGKDWIKLAKKDSQDGEHHWIPASWVESVDEKAVYLSKSVEEVRQGMKDEAPTTAQ